jgi:hypothetical protein
MSAHDNGGPAFPHQKDDGSPYWGMSLRDWFAGQALVGIATNRTARPYEQDAEQAYRYADAMLAERAKAEGQS